MLKEPDRRDFFVGSNEDDREVRPATEDPYGDPANEYGRYGNIRPATEDPYGDPAEQDYR